VLTLTPDILADSLLNTRLLMNAKRSSKVRLEAKVSSKERRGVGDGCCVEKISRTTMKYIKFVYMEKYSLSYTLGFWQL
jgi:hypothetical protein